MKSGASGSFGAQLRALREAAGFTQEELATIAGLSVHAVSALERGERRRPHVDTVRALSAALDLTGVRRDALFGSARARPHDAAADELSASSLPLTLTGLLGREVDVQALLGCLADGATRLITLVGPGGVGKTRLVLEVAQAIATEGATRVVFVPLAAIRNPVFVAAAIAEALGLSDVTAVDLPRRARSACGDRPTLLVLDNFEQVLAAAPLVVDLLTSVVSLRLLATSRAPLRVRGERAYAVGPLALETGSEEMSPADIARSPAVRLFVERARDVAPDFRLTSANAATVSAICRRLDALPLALELAAPWIKVLTVEDLLRRLDDDVLFSTIAGPRDLPERQQTINATVAWSYQLLRPDEQHVFRRLAALPGLFPLDAAAAVLAGREGRASGSDEAIGALAVLMDKSLLLRAPTSVVPTCPMYQMLETVRAYAALELAAAGERDDAFEGLVRYATAEAALAAEGMVGLAQVEWFDRVREDLETYRGALTWLIERGRSTEACDIAWGLLFFWMIRGHAVEGLRWYEQILRLPLLPPKDESRARLGAATMWYAQGRLEPARDEVTRALMLAQDAGDTAIAVHAETMLGHVELAFGKLDAAHTMFTHAIDGFQTLGTAWGHGHALSGLAWVALAMGDGGQAERLLDESTSVLRQVGPWFLLLTLYVRAILAVRREQPDAALALARQSLTRILELHDMFAFVYALVPLAAAAVQKGDDAWAARILGVRDALTERTGATFTDKSVDDLREQAEREVRARLSQKRWALAYAAGRTTSIDSLLKDVDRVLRGGGEYSRPPAG
jgi:predicted ATPase/transcriptional regulator with XRE-family HTH domain